MGWKAENNRHAEDSRIVFSLRALELDDGFDNRPVIYLNPEDLKKHDELLHKANRNELFMFPRTYPQFIARVVLSKEIPVGCAAMNKVQLANFELTADGLECFPWSCFNIVENGEMDDNKYGIEYKIVDLESVLFEIRPESLHESFSSNTSLDGKSVIQALSSVLLNHIITLHEKIRFKINGTSFFCEALSLRASIVEDDGESKFSEHVQDGSGVDDGDIYRGRIRPQTKIYVEKYKGELEYSFELVNSPKWPKDDEVSAKTVQIICKDGEWFPVDKDLLRPCLALVNSVRDSSVEAQKIHIEVDCCTFDRVLLFLIAEKRKQKYKIPLDQLENMLNASNCLKLLSLKRLCESMKGDFERRIRTEGISFEEVLSRNRKGETWLIIDGMVFDVTEWLPEHPGGNTIIPNQALNKDATVFFELYHASKESFIYLKQLYIGHLHSQDIPKVPQPSLNYPSPSPTFLQQLREYMRPENLTNYQSF